MAATAGGYTVSYSTGEVVTIRDGNIDVAVADTIATMGVLGPNNGNPADDFELPNGTVLNEVNGSLTYGELYKTFANAWRVTQAPPAAGSPPAIMSLFDYLPGQTTATFTNKNYPPAPVTVSDLPTSLVAKARAALAGTTFANAAQQQNAELDYILSGGNTALAQSDANPALAGTNTVAMVQSPPPVLYGVTPGNAATNVGTLATTATFDAFRTGSDVDTVVLNWTVVDTGSIQSVEAADYPGGVLPSGQVTIEAGSSLASFTVVTPAGLRLPTENLEVQISSPPVADLSFASTTASQVLDSSVPVKGIAAVPVLYLASGVGTLTGSGSNYTLNLGNVGADGIAPTVIGIQNQAAAYGDQLAGFLSETGPIQLGGSTFFTQVSSGQVSSFSVDASNILGPEMGTIVLADSETNSSGYQAVLPAITLTTLAYVTDPIALPSAEPASISVSGRIGGLLSPSLTFANNAILGSDNLSVSITDIGGNLVVPQTASIAPGGSLTTTFTDIAAAPGTFTDTLDVGYVSFDGNATQGSPLPGVTITVQGTSYQDAAPVLSGTTFDFGTVHQGDTAPIVSVGVNNGNAAGADSDSLLANLGSVGPFSGVGTANVAAGSSGTLAATLSTSTGGNFDDTGTVSFASHDSQFADAGLPGEQVTLLGTVIGDAVPAFQYVGGAGSLTQTGADTYVYNFGTVAAKSPALAAQFDVANLAADPADSFNGLLSISGSGTVLGATGTLAPGAVSATFEQDFSTATPGAFSESVVLTPTDSVVGVLPVETLTIEGTVATPACYCHGTMILTDRGEVAVEDLVIGSHVVTASGALRPVKWLGRRSYAGRFLAANAKLMPVRIAAGALGGALPRRDLLVSPMHAMYIDGILIPAIELVNGATILQMRGLASVHYVHVELEAHDLILAEGAPSETFVDDDSRMMFHNAESYFMRYGRADAPLPAYCAPRVTHGYALEAVRARLRGNLAA